MPRAIRRLFSTPLLLGGLALATPVLGQQAGQAVDATCRTMGPRAVEAICLSILLGSLIALALMERRLRAEGWSLADALSEPVTVGHNAGGGAPTIRRDASSSRLIAMAGMLVILLLYLGFGVFCLYSFGMTCTMPAESDAAARFLYSGLTLFAPYIANKFSNVFKPLIGRAGRPGAALAPAPAPDGVEPEPEAATAPAAAQPRQPSPAPATTPAAAAAPQRPAATAAASGRPAPPPHAAASPSPVAAPASARPAATASTVSTTTATTPPAAAAVPAVTGEADRDPDQAAVTLIADFEGFVDHAYPDPASGGAPWTIGYGFTTLQGRPVQPGDRLSRAEADELLRTGVAACAAHLAGTIPHWQEMADDQRCALISFAWNLGENFYGDSSDFATISRVLRERRWAEVPDALLLYCNPGTAVEAGLRRRRQAEGDLWRRGMAALDHPAGAATPGHPPAAPPARPTATAAPAPASAPAPGPAAPAAARANPLAVPWFDQLRMDDGQGWRDCFSASSAMLAAFWGREPDENTYNHLREHYGDSTSSEAQLAALRHLGLQADFGTDGTLATLRREIDAGRPVAVGWLHHGPPSAPTGGGHWTVVIGYDDSGVIMNDPYGSCDLVNGGYPANHNGARQHYSYRNWLPRWQPQNSGGWYLCCRPPA